MGQGPVGSGAQVDGPVEHATADRTPVDMIAEGDDDILGADTEGAGRSRQDVADGDGAGGQGGRVLGASHRRLGAGRTTTRWRHTRRSASIAGGNSRRPTPWPISARPSARSGHSSRMTTGPSPTRTPRGPGPSSTRPSPPTRNRIPA